MAKDNRLMARLDRATSWMTVPVLIGSVGVLLASPLLIASLQAADRYRADWVEAIREARRASIQPLSDDDDGATRSVQFRQCREIIAATADRFGRAPVNIVDSSALRIVRFVTADGSILVTCDAASGTMAVTKSGSRG